MLIPGQVAHHSEMMSPGYAEASWTQGLADWIGAHTRALEAVGGVSGLIVGAQETQHRHQRHSRDFTPQGGPRRMRT